MSLNRREGRRHSLRTELDRQYPLGYYLLPLHRAEVVKPVDALRSARSSLYGSGVRWVTGVVSDSDEQ